MAEPATLPVLDLNVLIAMYGDDSAETITLALSGFRREATHYVQQLQDVGQPSARKDHAPTDNVQTDNALADTARLCHSLKSMCGLVGAAKLMQLCIALEQAAWQQDLPTLQSGLLKLAGVWPETLAMLNLILLQHGYTDV
ncbi:Hpt domain-containing protein [Rheinheimera pacifica]|uniref:Hpt domain-containing protein n=1 Tax=Rheinheimera pacifica TaxID=173990 RepID=A0A1H6KPT2_9GAMM|nr:Hpt domain-containing protein [Rheinheimera pacifica]SEH74866.1 Hpt domain-containing protein [Rheinheimera pacifica]